MRDAFGRNIVVGDRVAFVQPGYRNLIRGTVIRITPQRVRVAYRIGTTDGEHLTPGSDVVVNPAEAR